MFTPVEYPCIISFSLCYLPAADAGQRSGRSAPHLSRSGTGPAGDPHAAQPSERRAARAARAEETAGRGPTAGSVHPSGVGTGGRALPTAAQTDRETGETNAQSDYHAESVSDLFC